MTRDPATFVLGCLVVGMLLGAIIGGYQTYRFERGERKRD